MSAPNPRADELRRRILAAAATPRGFTTSLIPDTDKSVLSDLCRGLLTKGQLFKATLGHRSVVWFTSAATAKCAEDSVNKVKAQRYERAAASKPVMRLNPELPVVVPEGVVVQKCPGFVPRWQGHVGAVAFGLQRGRVTS